jgi:hypothetical protein
MRPFVLCCSLVLAFLVSMSSLAEDDVSSSEPPSGAVARVVALEGRAVFTDDERTLMRFGGEHRLDDQAIQLHLGQWLRPGQVVMARENAVLTLRYVDGRETRLGPKSVPVYATIERPHPSQAIPAPTSPKAAEARPSWAPFEREHSTALVAAFGILIAVLPHLRRRPYQPGTGARLIAAALYVLLTLPVSLLILAGQTLGRIAWYQAPLPGADWTGAAATLANVANGASLILVFGGLLALWVLSIAFISGGVDRLDRRSAIWWFFAATGIACVTTAYLMPHLTDLGSLAPEWNRFWSGWAHDYSRGAWLLLPFAQILSCACAIPNATRRWQGVAASGILIVFVACYVVS